MSSPKEKSEELHVGFWRLTNDSRIAKQCALIAVDEIMDCTKNGLGLTKFSKEYWQDVKQEIEKL